MTIIEKARQFVEAEFKKPTSKYGYDPFVFHVQKVVKIAGKLADNLGGDREIVELAAWLHDIGSITHGRKDHHLTGANIAGRKLAEFGYPKEKIVLVKECILSHRGSQKIKPKTLEAQILIEADTLSAFDDIAGLFQCAYAYEKLSRSDAKKSIRNKLNNKWKQLKFKKSKSIVKPKFEAAMLLLND